MTTISKKKIVPNNIVTLTMIGRTRKNFHFLPQRPRLVSLLVVCSCFVLLLSPFVVKANENEARLDSIGRTIHPEKYVSSKEEPSWLDRKHEENGSMNNIYDKEYSVDIHRRTQECGVVQELQQVMLVAGEVAGEVVKTLCDTVIKNIVEPVVEFLEFITKLVTMVLDALTDVTKSIKDLDCSAIFGVVRRRRLEMNQKVNAKSSVLQEGKNHTHSIYHQLEDHEGEASIDSSLDIVSIPLGSTESSKVPSNEERNPLLAGTNDRHKKTSRTQRAY